MVDRFPCTKKLEALFRSSCALPTTTPGRSCTRSMTLRPRTSSLSTWRFVITAARSETARFHQSRLCCRRHGFRNLAELERERTEGEQLTRRELDIRPPCSLEAGTCNDELVESGIESRGKRSHHDRWFSFPARAQWLDVSV